MLYDFEERTIRFEVFEETDLTSGTKALVELVFNLYNGLPCRSIVDLFACLDERNRDLAIRAIRMRFRIGEDSGNKKMRWERRS